MLFVLLALAAFAGIIMVYKDLGLGLPVEQAILINTEDVWNSLEIIVSDVLWNVSPLLTNDVEFDGMP